MKNKNNRPKLTIPGHLACNPEWQASLRRLLGVALPGNETFALVKTVRKLEQDVKDLNQARLILAKRFGTQPLVIPASVQAEYDKELANLPAEATELREKAFNHYAKPSENYAIPGSKVAEFNEEFEKLLAAPITLHLDHKVILPEDLQSDQRDPFTAKDALALIDIIEIPD